MKKTKLLQVRLTEQEDQFIEQKMVEHGYKNKSEYVLNSVISPIRHDKKRQEKMLYEVNKIGVNLNQVVRKMHASNFVFVGLMTEIKATQDKLNEVLEEFKKQ
jgi:Arc/MetJ-type ribon-helix-helix transcriptional regulator